MASELARKVVHLLHAAEQLLSMQPNYDFGMRALKSILLAAGGALRDCNAEYACTDSLHSGAAEGLRQTVSEENTLFVHTLRDMILPKLTTADSLVVQELIQVCA